MDFIYVLHLDIMIPQSVAELVTTPLINVLKAQQNIIKGARNTQLLVDLLILRKQAIEL